ncbi:MAG: peptide chain release factor N(5)-glutamine methyltransferase [Paludibacter sp.]
MQTAIQHINSELKDLYPATEIKSFTYLIFEKLTGFSRTQLIVNKNTVFSLNQRYEIESIIEKLKIFVPIQYILGETEFYGLPFSVNESVLIPRPETEELVDWIRNENITNEKLSILDIGTGSGCIAISLKHKLKNVTVDAFDISVKSLEIAKLNAKMNNLDLFFWKIDILNAPDLDKKWDIIVSNPPYIPEQEKNEMHANVLENEPHIALFVPDNDPLLFYRRIALFAQKHLKNNGKLYFEIHRDAGQACVGLLKALGFKGIELRKDISGNDRMVKALI